ncbi:helix-turn-helix domain-containing protein [Providencia burhodogranariea]|uniref:Fimbrial operon regulator n=1 Tax=Providencia burhodogranariea DSM 19968 TaxID=1141662 RepID=K8W647_9GAMM|nr:helix-turn-helix transcriptional regulator [Providencia burhodogranariea]EKT55331.1 fimbrial operon regulator [Providencia burhodogranariea DSM 19968]
MRDNFELMNSYGSYDLENNSSFESNNDDEEIDLSLYKDKISKAIGQVIRENRLKRGMSGKELGDKLQISQQQVSRYERGVNQIDLPKFICLMKILEIRPYVIFEVINDVSILN